MRLKMEDGMEGKGAIASLDELDNPSISAQLGTEGGYSPEMEAEDVYFDRREQVEILRRIGDPHPRLVKISPDRRARALAGKPSVVCFK